MGRASNRKRRAREPHGPGMQALLDQANQTHRDFMKGVRRDPTFICSDGSVRAFPKNGKVDMKIKQMLAKGQLSDPIGPDVCGHYQGPPQEMYWVAWEPEVFLCMMCAIQASSDTSGTDECYRCDICKKIDLSGLHQTTSTLPIPIRYGRDGMPAIMPVITMAFVCDECSEVEPPSEENVVDDDDIEFVTLDRWLAE